MHPSNNLATTFEPSTMTPETPFPMDCAAVDVGEESLLRKQRKGNDKLPTWTVKADILSFYTERTGKQVSAPFGFRGAALGKSDPINFVMRSAY